MATQGGETSQGSRAQTVALRADGTLGTGIAARKVALVTGAAQGIGREIAVELARQGHNVAAVDLADAGASVREVESSGGTGMAVSCDVSRKEDVERAVREVTGKLGAVEVLVNNAGIYPFKVFADMTEADFDRVMGINLKGVFNFTKAVLPGMMARRRGRVVNRSSIAGTTVGFFGLVHYSASKAAIMGFSRSLALEVAPLGITVNAVAPGPVDTPGARPADAAQAEQIRRAIPAGRLGRPEDIAALVAFLASDRAGFITGQCIVIDGGYTIQ